MRVSGESPLLHTFFQLISLQFEISSPNTASFFHARTTLKMYDFVSHILLIVAEKVRILFFRLLQTMIALPQLMATPELLQRELILVRFLVPVSEEEKKTIMNQLKQAYAMV